MATTRGLYGGAIVGNLADNFADVSKFRQVPDNQEVFVDRDTDASIIVELLELEASASGLPAVHYHFKELAASNEATESSILSEGDFSGEEFIPRIPNAVSKLAVIGKQKAGKYRDRPDMKLDDVHIVLVLIRLGDVTTDMLVSLNMPNLPASDVPEDLNVNKLLFGTEQGEPAGPAERHIALLRDFLNTLEIKDWSLFK